MFQEFRRSTYQRTGVSCGECRKVVIDVLFDFVKQLIGEHTFTDYFSRSKIEARQFSEDINLKSKTWESLIVLTLKLPDGLPQKIMENTHEHVNDAFTMAWKRGEIRIVGDKLRLAANFFEPVLNENKEHFVNFLTNLLDDENNWNISVFYLNGENRILKSAFEEAFPEEKVLFPANSNLDKTCLFGALQYGHKMIDQIRK